MGTESVAVKYRRTPGFSDELRAVSGAVSELSKYTFGKR